MHDVALSGLQQLLRLYTFCAPLNPTPEDKLSLAAIGASALTLAMESWIVDVLAPALMDFFRLDTVTKEFILNDYLPEVGLERVN